MAIVLPTVALQKKVSGGTSGRLVGVCVEFVSYEEQRSPHCIARLGQPFYLMHPLRCSPNVVRYG